MLCYPLPSSVCILRLLVPPAEELALLVNFFTVELKPAAALSMRKQFRNVFMRHFF
jgi:hypothetical protein